MTDEARSTPADCPAAPMDVAPELYPSEGEPAAGTTETAAATTDSGEVRDA